MLLNGRFYYSSGRVRPTDQEMIPIEKVVTHSSEAEGHVMPQWDHVGSTMFGQREGANVGKNFYCGFLRKGQARKGRQV